jgi:transposase-like protein
MDQKYQKLSPEMKAKVAIEALKGDLKIIEIASKYKIHPKQVMRWRDQLVEESGQLFINKKTLQKTKKDPEKEELYHKIGQQAMDIDFLKKKLGK